MKGIVLFLALISFSHYSVAQDSLILYKDFFVSQKTEIENWISSTGLSEVFQIKEVEVIPNKVIIKMGSNYATDDSLATAWDFIQQEYYDEHRSGIHEKLFDFVTLGAAPF